MATEQTPAPEQQAPADNEAAQPEDDFEAMFAEYSGSQPADDTAEQEGGETGAESETAEGGEEERQAQAEQEEELTPREKELQAQLDRLQQSEASQRGRVGALQRQINEFKRNQGGQQRPAQGGQQASQPSNSSGEQQEADQKQAMAEAAGSDDWESLKQDFPDIARAVEARLEGDRQETARLQQEVADLRSTVQPMQEQAHEQYLGSQKRALEARHSDWKEVVNAPAFQQWLQQQPASISSLFESEDAAEAAALLDLYKSTNPPTGSYSAQGNAQAEAEREKRQQRLAGAVTPQRRGAAKRDAVPDDWEGQFNHFAKSKR
ncbi:hypothetical protein [Chromohalobacter canadensis]|uniref:hypothetical protein n=1 Tax=Chromohalobacter canadensis TaxID=141389 RepID=UPI00240F3568|nr:hypothetical protein [Chromohalobacter canadensis]